MFAHRIEPGLEQSETFYSLTYTLLFLGHTVAALISGFLFNFVPTWYLCSFAIFIHIGSYLLYAVTTSGWMMLVSVDLQECPLDLLLVSHSPTLV